MSAPTRNRWTAVIVLASLYVFYNAVELGIGDGGWPQIIGVPLGGAVAAYGVARLVGGAGLQG